LACKLLGPGA